MPHFLNRTSTTCSLVALACLTFASGVAAQGAPDPTPATQKVDVEASVEAAREATRSAAVWLASGVDSWFGNKPFSEGGQVNDGELNVKFYSRQDQKTDYSVTFNARFKLPNLEEKTYLFTGRDNNAGVVSDRPAVFSNKQRLLQPNSTLDTSFFAGLGRSFSDSFDARIGFQGGLKLYAQGRYRKEWKLAADESAEFSQTIYVTQADGVGSSSVVSYQRQFSPTLVGRWLNVVDVTQNDTNAEWNSSLGIFKSFGSQRLLSLELLASAKQNTGLPLTDYGVQARWEQPVLHNRLIGEIVLGHFWPQTLDPNDRTTAWAVGTGVKMKF
ncbi:MAG: hypothetical protein CFE43_17480 [Burkholderiales bacterium PBB3]|nr:MAG: hypothetical protein CFE43_17480 [Burkholderiales bacterium PBB3]